MNVEIDEAILRLDQHHNLTLRDANGGCIHVHWGNVWVTRNGDIKDYIVNSGESLAIDRPGTTVLTALRDAGVSLMTRCGRSEATPVTSMKEVGDATGGAKSEALKQYAESDDARAHAVGRGIPDYREIDRHVEYAHQLRASYVGKALRNGWLALRGLVAG
jgi:hypothetical protein